MIPKERERERKKRMRNFSLKRLNSQFAGKDGLKIIDLLI